MACVISATSDHMSQAADLLTYLVSSPSAEKLASTGYVMPTNVEAVNGDAFLQRGQRPLHADVFEREMRHVQELPRSRYWPDVAQTTVSPLYHLFYDPVIASLAGPPDRHRRRVEAVVRPQRHAVALTQRVGDPRRRRPPRRRRAASRSRRARGSPRSGGVR